MSDIFRRDIAHPFRRSAAGDLAAVDGIDNLRAATFRRLAAKPGSVLHRQTYGAGVGDFLNLPATIANRQRLMNRIKAELAKERRIDKVLSVTVGEWTDGQIDVTFRVQAFGQVQDFEFRIGG